MKLTERPTPETDELSGIDAPSSLWKQSHERIEQRLGVAVEALEWERDKLYSALDPDKQSYAWHRLDETLAAIKEKK